MKTILASLLLALALTGCSNTPESSVGAYSGDDFSAQVQKDYIEIYIVSDNTKSLYWAGTWSDGYSEVISKADSEALDGALFASTSKTKDFTVSDDSIEFEFGIMGTTTDVSLDKE